MSEQEKKKDNKKLKRIIIIILIILLLLGGGLLVLFLLKKETPQEEKTNKEKYHAIEVALINYTNTKLSGTKATKLFSYNDVTISDTHYIAYSFTLDSNKIGFLINEVSKDNTINQTLEELASNSLKSLLSGYELYQMNGEKDDGAIIESTYQVKRQYAYHSLIDNASPIFAGGIHKNYDSNAYRSFTMAKQETTTLDYNYKKLINIVNNNDGLIYNFIDYLGA